MQCHVIPLFSTSLSPPPLQITKSYSKVPAELVSLFTKNCQTCLGVRKYSKNKRPILNENEYSQQHSHPSQQQQQQQLTCDTNTFSSSPSSSASSATPQYHTQQPYQTLISKNEQGTMTPISPLMHPSNSGFFGSSGAPQQLDSSFSQSQLSHIQQQQMQQMHNVAMNAHHMSMTLDLSQMSLEGSHVGGIGNLSGLGHINTGQLHGSMAALDSTCSTPTTMAKMGLPSLQAYDPNSMSNALISFSQLAQQTQYQSALSSMGSPSEQYDHEQMDAMGASISSSAQYSPLLEEHYATQHQHQQYQHAFHTTDFATVPYTTTDQQLQQQQLQSTYSAAMSLTSMPLMHHDQQYEQPGQSQEYQHESSPLLSQNQMFQQQIQQEQQRFQQQQQLSVSTSFSTLSGSGSSTSLSSSPPSAVPSLSCSIATPTSATSPTPLLASVAHSNAFMSAHLHPANALTSLVEHEQKTHLSVVADLVSSHDL